MAETISDTHCTYPWRGGQAEWAWVAWINAGMVDPPKVITNRSTNRAHHSLTSLMWQTPLPLCQTSHHREDGVVVSRLQTPPCAETTIRVCKPLEMKWSHSPGYQYIALSMLLRQQQPHLLYPQNPHRTRQRASLLHFTAWNSLSLHIRQLTETAVFSW